MKEVFLPQTDIGRWMDIADFPNEIWKDVIGFEVTDKLAWDSIKILELMYYEIKQ